MTTTASRPSTRSPPASDAWGPDAPWTVLRDAYYRLMKLRGGVLRRFGLSLSEYSALRLCAEAPSILSDIAEMAGVTSAGATDIVDRLEARRLVRRLSDSKDRRAVRVALTPPGRRLFREAQSTQRAMFRDLSRSLSSSERKALVNGLSSLIRSLSSHEA